MYSNVRGANQRCIAIVFNQCVFIFKIETINATEIQFTHSHRSHTPSSAHAIWTCYDESRKICVTRSKITNYNCQSSSICTEMVLVVWNINAIDSCFVQTLQHFTCLFCSISCSSYWSADVAMNNIIKRRMYVDSATEMPHCLPSPLSCSIVSRLARFLFFP